MTNWLIFLSNPKGKELAKVIEKEINQEGPVQAHDSSTRNLINFYKKFLA